MIFLGVDCMRAAKDASFCMICITSSCVAFGVI